MEKQSNDKGQLQLLENNSTEFANNTCAQINKDLQGVSLAMVALNNIEAPTIFEHLIHQLNPILENLAEQGKLSQFIYLVDLNEREFKNSFAQQDFSELSYLVIKREAQKVYLKNKFRHYGALE
tara:strand:- start:4513 stop:4884 length:372 start_codon:yes stop_codon:yes gene_type:complete